MANFTVQRAIDEIRVELRDNYLVTTPVLEDAFLKRRYIKNKCSELTLIQFNQFKADWKKASGAIPKKQ